MAHGTALRDTLAEGAQRAAVTAVALWTSRAQGHSQPLGGRAVTLLHAPTAPPPHQLVYKPLP